MLPLVLHHGASQLLLPIGPVLHVVGDHGTRHISFSVFKSRRTQTQLLTRRSDRVPDFLDLVELLLFRRARQSGLRFLTLGHPATTSELGDVIKLLGRA